LTSDTLLLTVDSLNADGDGVARHRGRPVTIPFTIPGERVAVRLRPVRDGHLVGDVLEIVEASPHRIVPRCPHFGPAGECGGCAWQHIAYPEQLRLKTALVDRLVRESLRDTPAARPTIPGTDPRDPWGYRHKVHFVFGSSHGRVSRGAAPLVMGHYAHNSRRVIPVHECPVHDERGNTLAFQFRDAFTASGVAAADRGRTGVLRSVAVRVGCHTPEIVATLVVSADTDKRLRAATRRVIEANEPAGLHVNLHPRGDAFIFGRDTRRIVGAERMREQIGDTSFLVSPTAFFQTNVHAAETLVRLVLDAIPARATVLDLYAGAGLFALPLARRGNRVVAVEENRAAVADGEASRRLNRITEAQCRFVASQVERVLDADTEAIVLDPPRAGCAPIVIDNVFAPSGRPSRAVYVSCDPEALARDLRLIVRRGWTIDSIQPVDMFPHTPHIETVVVLDKSR
jgi:23S rRNA (uracil-5-)-methyltransferase RumA